MTSSFDGTADVLDNGPPERVPAHRRVRLRSAVPRPAVALLVPALGAAVVLGIGERQATRTVSVTGTLDLDVPSVSTPASLVPDRAQQEVLSGPLTVTTGRRMLATAARLQVAGTSVPARAGPAVMHQWGTALVTLHRSPCQGPFIWSYHDDSGAGVGTLSLRCADGSVLAGRLHLTGYRDPQPDHLLRRIVLVLDQARYSTRG